MMRALTGWAFAILLLGPGAASAVAQHQHDQGKPATEQPAAPLPPFIPPVTDDDRQAAFPEVPGHAIHDRALNYYVLFDQLEWQSADGIDVLNANTKGWIGGDRNRLWFRAEGDGTDGRVQNAEAHALLGRQIARWWDVVGGVRQDLRPGPAQTWAAVGLQGLAPYWFEIHVTGYVGASGRTQLRAEAEYELLLTNRLRLQPRVEANVFGKSDPERRTGAGLSTTEAGFRLRYEFRRELAPYVGVEWRTNWGKTADLADASGEKAGGARFVAGLRFWF
jgi:copper resistance protein B